MTNIINIIDLFSGPGGLSEGFTSYNNNNQFPYKVLLSAEKDYFSHETLKTRTFYHQFRDRGIPDEYYEYIRSPDVINKKMLFNSYKDEYKSCLEKVLNTPRELGNADDDRFISNKIKNHIKANRNQINIVIGGPPCQAYSLVGRSRNRGIKNYQFESDGRATLYKEYLNILECAKPEVFVMENVKGLLSVKYNNELMFPQVLEDLKEPGKALGKKSGYKYRIYSFASEPDKFIGGDPVYKKSSSYTIKMENYDIPQRRHRVILLGIRSDIDNKPGILDPSKRTYSIKSIINCLPPLRSGLSRQADSLDEWLTEIKKAGNLLVRKIHSEEQKN